MKYLFNLWADVKKQPLGTIITSHYGVIRWVQGPGSIINYSLASPMVVEGGDPTDHYLSHFFIFSHRDVIGCAGSSEQKDNDKIILW